MKTSMLSRRDFLRVAAGTGAAAALVACVPAPPAAPAAGAEMADMAVTEVLMFDRNVVQDLEYRKELAERFNAENGDIQVAVDVIPQGYDQTIMARIAGGTAGDAFRHASHFGMSKFTTRGLLQELDDFVDLDSYDLSVYIEGPLSSNRINGKLCFARERPRRSCGPVFRS
jgi:ABC-type glycerol-3-phosphate transport system substrate-binding protein